MRHFIAALLLVIGMIGGASTAAWANPLEWRHETKGSQLEIVFRAHEDLRYMEAVVNDVTQGKARTFRRDSLKNGAEWRVRVSNPRVPTQFRVDFKGRLGQQEVTGYYEFPAGPEETLDYRLASSRFEGTYNELQILADAPVVLARVLARGEDGSVILEFTRDMEGTAGEPLPLIFHTPSPVLSVDVLLTAKSGATREYRYTPWAFQTESRGLNFATGSAEIQPSDELVLRRVYDELQAAVQRVGQHVELQLYIGGYTDTVGSDAANQALSMQRAAAIGNFMRQRGVQVPIFVQGFGERAPAVATADGVDEPANRRAVFVVCSGAPPVSGNFPTSAWRPLR